MQATAKRRAAKGKQRAEANRNEGKGKRKIGRTWSEVKHGDETNLVIALTFAVCVFLLLFVEASSIEIAVCLLLLGLMKRDYCTSLKQARRKRHLKACYTAEHWAGDWQIPMQSARWRWTVNWCDVVAWTELKCIWMMIRGSGSLIIWNVMWKGANTWNDRN